MIAFTIYSNNYLGYARALAGSIEENCDVSEFIFICDVKKPDINYESIQGCRLVFPAELGIAGWADMVERYTTVELNTSIKPFAFDWCFENYEDDYVCFLDPDVYVLADLSCCVNVSTFKKQVWDKESHAHIASAGREWVIENYSPVPTALRLLQLLKL